MEKNKEEIFIYLKSESAGKPENVSPNATWKNLEAKPGSPLQILIEMLCLAFTFEQKRKHKYKFYSL